MLLIKCWLVLIKLRPSLSSQNTLCCVSSTSSKDDFWGVFLWLVCANIKSCPFLLLVFGDPAIMQHIEAACWLHWKWSLWVNLRSWAEVGMGMCLPAGGLQRSPLVNRSSYGLCRSEIKAVWEDKRQASLRILLNLPVCGHGGMQKHPAGQSVPLLLEAEGIQ